jgi:hypothetical protein
MSHQLNGPLTIENLPQQCIVALRQSQARHQPLGGPSTGRMRQQTGQIAHSHGACAERTVSRSAAAAR